MADNMVRLFYLGGLGHPSRKLTIVRSRGKVYTLPPVGEFIEVPEFIANDLISRHKVDIRNEGRFEAFTLDHRIARRVKELGDIKAQSAIYADPLTRNSAKEDVLGKLSVEELQMLLAEKMSEVDDDNEAAVKAKKTVKKPASKAAVKKPAAKKVSGKKTDADDDEVVEASKTVQTGNSEIDDFSDGDDEDNDDDKED